MIDVDVAFTPAGARSAGVTVVVDVLRATSTIVQALEAGYHQVLCADGLDRARALAGPGRVLAGERRCVPPADFDLGNSPSEMQPPRGRELVLATTNGAPAIVRAAELSPVVLVASLLNLDAAVEAIDGDDVQLLCSGVGGRPALEDTYVAGRLALALGGRHADSAMVAGAVARAYPGAGDAFAECAGGRALVQVGLRDDLEWCARESVVSVVPRVVTAQVGTATLRPL